MAKKIKIFDSTTGTITNVRSTENNSQTEKITSVTHSDNF